MDKTEMITIGVTGGVGAGKSEILRYLGNNYNCRILMSDNAAKELELPGGALYEPLKELLTQKEGQGSLLQENGEFDKQEMARRIFADPLLLQKVNELVHPAVNRYILDEIVREAENCEESARAQRLRGSRGYSDEKIRSIIKRQVSDEVFRSHCDTVIDNTGDFYAPDGAAVQVDAAIARLRAGRRALQEPR